MNKTVVFITFAALAALGIMGGVYLLAERPDASATFTNLLVLVLGLVVTAAGTFYGLGRANEKLDTVQKQTNGTLSALMEENRRLTRQLEQLAANRTEEQ